MSAVIFVLISVQKNAKWTVCQSKNLISFEPGAGHLPGTLLLGVKVETKQSLVLLERYLACAWVVRFPNCKWVGEPVSPGWSRRTSLWVLARWGCPRSAASKPPACQHEVENIGGCIICAWSSPLPICLGCRGSRDRYQSFSSTVGLWGEMFLANLSWMDRGYLQKRISSRTPAFWKHNRDEVVLQCEHWGPVNRCFTHSLVDLLIYCSTNLINLEFVAFAWQTLLVVWNVARGWHFTILLTMFHYHWHEMSILDESIHLWWRTTKADESLAMCRTWKAGELKWNL